MLKIVYELACHWLGDVYLDDPTAGLLRSCILDNNLPDDWVSCYPIRETIDFSSDVLLYPFWADEPHSHIAFLMNNDDYISAYVRIFETIEGHVIVSEGANRYPNFKGMFLSNNPVKGDVREVALSAEFARIGKAGQAFVTPSPHAAS